LIGRLRAPLLRTVPTKIDAGVREIKLLFPEVELLGPIVFGELHELDGDGRSVDTFEC
jgi:hypothetical protein